MKKISLNDISCFETSEINKHYIYKKDKPKELRDLS